MVVHGGKSAASGECSSARAKAMRRFLRHRKEAQLVSRVIEGGKGATCWKRRHPCEGFFGMKANQFNKKEVSKGGRGRKRISKQQQQQRRQIKLAWGTWERDARAKRERAAKEAKCAGR